MERGENADEIPDDQVYRLFFSVMSREAANLMIINRRLGRHINENTKKPAEAGYWFTQNEPMLRRYAQNQFGQSQEGLRWLEAVQKGSVPQNMLEGLSDALSAASDDRLMEEAKRRGLLEKKKRDE